ncbi:hypothetical protein CDD83_7163 [Cordyceps sp. RAO-2017]|nr:hypothetical protein CDD83_7163 [Cordyceps sp. RAO-2017]
MAPLSSLVTLLLLWVGSAASERFTLAKTIDRTNFYSEFDFMTTGRDTSRNDDNYSFVKYQNLDDAKAKNITRIQNGDVYLGVDHETVLNASQTHGRDTFRIQTRDVFNHGLFVAHFTHLPKPACGSWPAYWFLADGPWPVNGEMDIYEGWHLQEHNRPSFKTGTESQVGTCIVDKKRHTYTANTISSNCDNKFNQQDVPPFQWEGQGCMGEETQDDIWGRKDGGIQAVVWTSEAIQIYTWRHGNEPASLQPGANPKEIDTSTWGTPSFQLRQCDIDRAFRNQRLLLDIAFCGGSVGDKLWGEGPSGGVCSQLMPQNCVAYVAENPGAFDEVYFQIKDIRRPCPPGVE